MSVRVLVSTYVSNPGGYPGRGRWRLFDYFPRFLIEEVHAIHVDGELDGLMNGSCYPQCRYFPATLRADEDDEFGILVGQIEISDHPIFPEFFIFIDVV